MLNFGEDFLMLFCDEIPLSLPKSENRVKNQVFSKFMKISNQENLFKNPPEVEPIDPRNPILHELK